MSAPRPPRGPRGRGGPRPAGDRASARAPAPHRPGRLVELTVDSLAAGGDGVGREEGGKVVFLPRTAPGDRVRAELVQETASFARGEVRELLAPSPWRRPPICPAFTAGCGGCQWLHVDEAAQRQAKQQAVTSALRHLPHLRLAPLSSQVPPLGWRRRARFHVQGGKLGLYAGRSHQLVETPRCPQLDPRLAAVLPLVAAAAPPDGELALAVGLGDRVALAHPSPWPRAAALVGQANIAGVAAAGTAYGEPVLELEPGLYGRADAFAQASAEGNAAILAAVRAAVPDGEGRAALELYAGAGNLTRVLVERGWQVTASDVVAPAQPLPGVAFFAGEAAAAMQRFAARRDFAAVLLDPPRAGARDIIEPLAALAAARIIYVSCDVATLARDARALEERGYRAVSAQPIDTMPQTSHLEVVLVLERAVGS